MINRRSLLKRLGAALVAAPVLAVTATGPAEAAPEVVEDARAEAYNRGYDVATARAESRAAAAPETIRVMHLDGSVEEYVPVSDEEMAKRILQNYHDSPEGQRFITERAREMMGLQPDYAAERFRKGYDEGLRRGMGAAVERYYDIEALGMTTMAHIDGRYVARLDPA